MKTTLLGIAAAGLLALAIAAPASAAPLSSTSSDNLASPAISAQQTDANLVQAGFKHRFHRGFRFKRFGHDYNGYGRFYYGRQCRRLHYLGFVRGIRYYRYMYNRHCR